MVTRELFLFSGFLVPQKNVTPQVVFKFLKVFEWEEEKDSEANEASDRRQYLEIDTYNLTPNQRIRVNLLLPASGTIRFTSQGYRVRRTFSLILSPFLHFPLTMRRFVNIILRV